MLRYLAPLTLCAFATAAHAQDDHRFAVAPAGPGAGHGAGAVGLGPMVLTNAALPSLSIQYTYGLMEHLDLYVTTDLGFNLSGSFGLLGVVDVGLQARFLPRSAGFQAGAKLAPEVLFFAVPGDRGGGVFLFGTSPGLFLGGGSSAFQAALGVDVPLYFVGALVLSGGGGGSGSGFSAALRPYAVVEGAITPQVGLFAKVAAELALSGGGGLLFVNLSAGVSF